MEDKQTATMIGVFMVAGLVLAMITMTGCSIHAEFGWHGKTGRDDRIQTQLVKDNEKGEKY